jgi:hypothetical protein
VAQCLAGVELAVALENQPMFSDRSELLPGRSEQDFVDVQVFGLTHGKYHHICERVSREPNLVSLATMLCVVSSSTVN